jgi:hypothetical protein
MFQKTKFIKYLEDLEINPLDYLKRVRRVAKSQGYLPLLINFSDDEKHKLIYNGKRFGSAFNNDYIIYKILYEKGLYTKDEIDKKRDAYRARARTVMLKTNDDESPATLSFYILW